MRLFLGSPIPTLLNFRMWFKNGLKAQKLQKQHALKGQKPLAQGIALGNYGRKPVAPVRAKALKLQTKHKAFALTGRLTDCHYTQGDALG